MAAVPEGGSWVDWHRAYDDPGTELSARLRAVQRRIADALDSRPDGPIPVLSVCAGQGRDLLGVLTRHPRRADVRARLVELDPANADAARTAASASGLEGVEVVTGDASSTTAYAGMAPSTAEGGSAGAGGPIGWSSPPDRSSPTYGCSPSSPTLGAAPAESHAREAEDDPAGLAPPATVLDELEDVRRRLLR